MSSWRVFEKREGNVFDVVSWQIPEKQIKSDCMFTFRSNVSTYSNPARYYFRFQNPLRRLPHCGTIIYLLHRWPVSFSFCHSGALYSLQYKRKQHNMQKKKQQQKQWYYSVNNSWKNMFNYSLRNCSDLSFNNTVCNEERKGSYNEIMLSYFVFLHFLLSTLKRKF